MRSSFEPIAGRARPGFVAAGSAPAPEAPEPSEAASQEALLEQHYARGREDARAELEAEARTRVDGAVAALGATGEELARVLDEERAVLRTAAIELGLTLAERLVAGVRREDCDAVAPLVEEALHLLPASGPREIVLSPADAELVGEHRAPALERLCNDWQAELVADAALAPGDARVRGGEARVDLTVEKLVERFREGLLEQLPFTEVSS